jgi:REP element-mobilizing transposase RayT
MPGDRYFITDPYATYYLTMTVVDWVDAFTRPAHKSIIVDSLNYCTREKGLVVYAWVLMSNHLHLIARTHEPHTMSSFLRDFKKFTSKKLVEAIGTEPESRREWMMHRFTFEAKRSGRAEQAKFWRDDNHAELLFSPQFTQQKLRYLHENPVRQAIVAYPEHYLYSSATDYAGTKGLVDVELI